MSIQKALDLKKPGYHIGHRLILPFRCQILKVIVHNTIYTEMVGSKHIKINQEPQNTSIYFRSLGELDRHIHTYEVIKLLVCEEDEDLTDISKHIKLICEIKDNHAVNIHIPSDDMLFIE